jgi:hypothetical protein
MRPAVRIPLYLSALVIQNTSKGVTISHYTTISGITGTLLLSSSSYTDDAGLRVAIEAIFRNMPLPPT